MPPWVESGWVLNGWAHESDRFDVLRWHGERRSGLSVVPGRERGQVVVQPSAAEFVERVERPAHRAAGLAEPVHELRRCAEAKHELPPRQGQLVDRATEQLLQMLAGAP